MDGNNVGSNVGLSVGDNDGSIVGASVGWRDGISVGAIVGARVGSNPTMKNTTAAPVFPNRSTAT